MSTFSEIGHAKNVANFEDLISFCTGYGAAYNPSLTVITLSNLSTIKSNADSALTSTVSNFNILKNATNDREIAFLPLKPLCTRIISLLKASGVSEQTLKDAITINRKIQGKRAKAIKTPPPSTESSSFDSESDTDVTTISTSQQSYDSKIEFFGKLIDLLTTIPAYAPNEVDAQIASLNAMIAYMKATNTTVITATTNFSNTKISRDNILYKAISGLVDVAQEVKAYVKGVFGAKSPEYKQVSKLKFSRKRK